MRCDTVDPYRTDGKLKEQVLDVLVHGTSVVPQGPRIK